MTRLSIYREGEAVLEHPLARGVTSLGRHTDNDVVLDDLALSRFHARIEFRADQHLVVDLGSQNGVYVNGQRIQGEARLRPGDRIGFGRYVAVYDQDVSQRLEPLPKEDSQSEDGDGDPGPALTLLFNSTEMERFPLKGQGYVIGRSHSCDIVIGLLGLSRRHARVFRNAAGHWAVEDLGSQNGTHVNNERINALRVLIDRDVINFFEYSLVFRAGDEDAGTDLELNSPNSTLVGDAPAGLSSTLRVTSELAPEDPAAFEQGATDTDGGPMAPLVGRRPTRTFSNVRAPTEEFQDTTGLANIQWPSERETDEALSASTRLAPAGVIEVRQDGRLLTEVPLDRTALRIGSDARCDVALPPLTAISGWHLAVVRVGETVLLVRVGDSAPPRMGGRSVAQAFLKEGDIVELGRISLRFRRR